MTTINRSRHPASRACALIIGLYALCGITEALTFLITGVAP